MLRVLILLLLLSESSWAIFGLENIKPEISLLKASVAQNADAVVKVDAKVAQEAFKNADAAVKMNARIGNVEARVQAQAAAIAGVNNKVESVSVGRDQTTTTTTSNDTKMLMSLNNIFKIIILALLGQMIALVRFTAVMYGKIIEHMQGEITRILTSKDKKEGQLDEWQQRMIEQSFGRGSTQGSRETEAIFKAAEGEVKP